MELSINIMIIFSIMFGLSFGCTLYANATLSKTQTKLSEALNSIAKAEEVLEYLYKLYGFIDKAGSITDKDHAMFSSEIKKYENKISELNLDEHGKFMVLSTTAWLRELLDLKHTYTKG